MGEVILYITLGGNMERFRAALIDIDTRYFTGRVKECVILNPICDLIIGNIEGIHHGI